MGMLRYLICFNSVVTGGVHEGGHSMNDLVVCFWALLDR